MPYTPSGEPVCCVIKAAPRHDIHHDDETQHKLCTSPKNCNCTCRGCVQAWIRNGAPGGLEVIVAQPLTYERLEVSDEKHSTEQ